MTRICAARAARELASQLAARKVAPSVALIIATLTPAAATFAQSTVPCASETSIAMSSSAMGLPPLLRGQPDFLAHQIGGLLADHDRRGVGAAGNDGRHDRGVGDAQPGEAAHPQFGVDDRQRVLAHLARAGRVVYG